MKIWTNVIKFLFKIYSFTLYVEQITAFFSLSFVRIAIFIIYSGLLHVWNRQTWSCQRQFFALKVFGGRMCISITKDWCLRMSWKNWTLRQGTRKASKEKWKCLGIVNWVLTMMEKLLPLLVLIFLSKRLVNFTVLILLQIGFILKVICILRWLYFTALFSQSNFTYKRSRHICALKEIRFV